MKKMKLGKKQASLLAVIVALVVAAVALALRPGQSPPSEPAPPVVYYSQLTGRQVSQEDAERPILGVIVENSEFARPQTGLGSAGIVFEAQTEGGITRYLALYQENQPATIGPVRSLRPHFVDWGMGFMASFVHVGGSAQALQMVQERPEAQSLNQFNYPEPYARNDGRPAPHDVYVQTKALRKLQAELDYSSAGLVAFPRKDDAVAEITDAKTVRLNFSVPAFRVDFSYNSATNSYDRSLAGTPDIDAGTNTQITAKNVVVLVVKTPGEGVTAIGKGKALVFMDGIATEASWEKTTHDHRLRLVDTQNNELPLNRGTTWIAAITSQSKVDYSAAE